MTDLLPAVEHEPAVPARATIIWLHGLGADGHDFAGIVPELRLPADAGVRFVFPHAPPRPVTLNGGYVMRAWYDLAGLDRPAGEDDSGIRGSQEHIEALIRRERGRGISSGRIVLAGFSQGGAMALHTALRHPEPLAGVLALSTYVPLASKLEAERNAANRATPIFMAHGDSDTVISLSYAQVSCNLLERLGYSVEWHGYAMGHSVCAQEIAEIAVWLERVLV